MAPSQQNDWLLWQLADSAFPAGGFAHSNGLEAAWQQGELQDPAELTAFIEASLSQLGHAALPFMNEAMRAVIGDCGWLAKAGPPCVRNSGFSWAQSATTDDVPYNQKPMAVIELDCLCDSFITNHVANRASRLQGQAMLASAQRIFALPNLRPVRQPTAETLTCRHLAPVFGVIAGALGLRRLTASRLFFFIHLRGLIAAAVRLGIVGPLQGQALQRSLTPCAEDVMLRCQNLSLDEIVQTSPLLELWQANQDRLYSRLFQS